jgi:hypothetical protein
MNQITEKFSITRRSFIFLLLLTFAAKSTLLSGQNDTFENKDPEVEKSKYAFGAIPVFAFDADLGLKYGAVLNFFDYGDRLNMPAYDQYLYFRFTNTTKGSLTLQSVLESEKIFSKAKVIAEASFLRDKNLDFFGFNGMNSVYNAGFRQPENPDFINKFYYSHKRSLLRLRLDLHHNIIERKLRLLTGYTYKNYKTDPIDPPLENETVNSPAPELPATLFDQYNEWGIIPENEKNGGSIHMLTLGLVYDTRKELNYSKDGIWVEAAMLIAPGFLNEQSFSRFVFTYRHHEGILQDKIIFSLRLSSQHKISGRIPFYELPVFYDSRLSQDGVGGAFNLRGAFRNRIVADGFLLGNFETKFKLLEFTLFKQSFYTSFSVFYDIAQVTQAYKTDLSRVPEALRPRYFNNNKQQLHHTLGPGFYIVFNQNNVITVNYGFSTNPQDGIGGLYIGSSLLF